MDEQDAAILDQLRREKDAAISQNPISNVANSMIAANQDSNLIEWQLELDNILLEKEHLFRGDILVTTKQGQHYVTHKDKELRPLNEFGVQYVMGVLRAFVNRNTLLSNYTEERIQEILYSLGNEVIDFMYINAEKMGMDTPSKQSRYSFLFVELIFTIESAYNRAYMQGERESLRTARVVTQSDNMNLQQQMPGAMKQQKTSLFNPMSWFR